MAYLKKDALRSRTRIVIAYDFSPPSDAALREGMSLARAAGAEVVLLHVTPMDASDDARRGTRTLLARRIERVRRVAPEVRLRLETADGVVEGILDALDAERPDVAIIGTHARAGLERMLLGSVAERVVHDAACPVLVVRANLPIGARFRRLVVGVDFSPAAWEAVRVVSKLALALDAEVLLLHAESPAEHLNDSRVRLERLAADLRAKGVRALAAVTIGEPAGALLAETGDSRDSVIATGTRNRTPAARALLGSVADAVLRNSRCPVLVAHSPEHRQGILSYVRMFTGALALLAAAGCVYSPAMRNPERPERPPDVAPWESMSESDLHSNMGALAKHVRVLDESVRVRRTATQAEIVAELTAMIEIADRLSTEEARHAHPALARNIDQYRADLRLAKAHALADPPNYFLAGSVVGACSLCH